MKRENLLALRFFVLISGGTFTPRGAALKH